jgi:hypothetical protein
LDENGKWTKGVHKEMTVDAAKGLNLNSEKINAMVKGNLAVDKNQNDQSLHAMIDATMEAKAEIAGISIKEYARNMMEDKIQAALQQFRDNEDYEELGAALHTIQDSYCPSHKGFQKWHSLGIFNPMNWPHALGDIEWGNEEEYNQALEATKRKLKEILKEIYPEEFENNTGADPQNEQMYK